MYIPFNNRLNHKIGFNVYSIQGEIQPSNPQLGFNVYSIQKQIQPLNPQVGFKG